MFSLKYTLSNPQIQRREMNWIKWFHIELSTGLLSKVTQWYNTANKIKTAYSFGLWLPLRTRRILTKRAHDDIWDLTDIYDIYRACLPVLWHITRYPAVILLYQCTSLHIMSLGRKPALFTGWDLRLLYTLNIKPINLGLLRATRQILYSSKLSNRITAHIGFASGSFWVENISN